MGGTTLSTTFGTAYAIAQPFRVGYSYNITVVARKYSNDNGSTPSLELGAIAALPNPNATNPQACGSVDQNKWVGLQSTRFLAATLNDRMNYQSFNIPNYTPQTNLSYLTVLAFGGSTTSASTVYISGINIVETLVTPKFTITPASFNVVCGSSTTQTITVNNVNNTPGTITYDWDLGSASNGWLYNGTPAPATFTTSANSIQLTSSPTAPSLANISVTVKINGVANTTLTCTPVVTSSAFNFSIVGPGLICNSSDYSVPNLPAGASVSWSISPSASVLQLAQNTPNANELRIANQRWHGFSTTLTATVTGLPCGATATATKAIANDNDNSGQTTYQYMQENCLFYNVDHPAESGTITSKNVPVFLHQGCMVYVNLGDMTNRTVTYTGSVPLQYWNFGSTAYAANTLYFQMPIGSGGTPFTLKIGGDGACYEKTLMFFSISGNGRMAAATAYDYEVAPNLVKYLLTITASKKMDANGAKETTPTNNINYSFNICDGNTNQIILAQKNIRTGTRSVDVSRLRPGLYVVQILEGENIKTIKFLKQ